MPEGFVSSLGSVGYENATNSAANAMCGSTTP